MNVHAFALNSTTNRSIEQTMIRLRFIKKNNLNLKNQLTRTSVFFARFRRSHGANASPSHFANFSMRRAKSIAVAEAL